MSTHSVCLFGSNIPSCACKQALDVCNVTLRHASHGERNLSGRRSDKDGVIEALHHRRTVRLA